MTARTKAGRYWIETTKALTEPPDLLNLVATVEAIVAQVEVEAAQPSALQGMAMTALVRRIAEIDIRAWQRDGEEVVTIRRSDVDRLLAIVSRARGLTRTRRRIEAQR